MKISLLRPGKGNYYRFQAWFSEAWQQDGGNVIADSRLPHKVRALAGRFLSYSSGRHNKRLMVCGCHRIESCAWPWMYEYEIIPVMWDLWPGNYDDFVRFARRCHIRQMLCTASQSAEEMRRRLPGVSVKWLSEGVNVSEMPMGSKLLDRPIDILCYGRSMPNVQAAIDHVVEETGCRFVHDGGPTFEDLMATVRQSRISICYPLCDTNPSKARGVETVTQRYWESMLSGTILAGRAPRELIELCGYNPVIELGERPVERLLELLKRIGNYQELAEKNRAVAARVGSWASRMDLVKEFVCSN